MRHRHSSRFRRCHRHSGFAVSHSTSHCRRPNGTFLQRHLLGVRRPDTTSRSLLARLTETGVGPAANDLWVTEIADVADSEDREALVTARQAAALAGIGRGVYAALVELARANDGLPESTIHQDHLEEMFELHGNDAGAVDLDALRKTSTQSPRRPL